MDLSEDEKVIEFFLEREIKPATQTKYYTHLKHYIEHAGDGLTPTELIQEARSEERQGIYIEDRKIHKRFIRFKAWLLTANWDESTKKIALSNIKTFYKTLHINEVPPTTIKVPRKKQIKITHLPSQEDVKKAVLAANVKYQSILLLMASSGLMQSDIIQFKVTDFIESFNKQAHTNFTGIDDIRQLVEIAEKKEIVLKWEGERAKNSIEYMTFSSTETTKAIAEYLRTDPPRSRDDFLFRNKGQKIRIFTLDNYIQFINDKLGLTGGEDKYKRIIPRNLRKRFGSLLTEAELGYRHIEYMMGHVLPPVQGAYFKLPGEDVMRRAYLKALPYLMILEPMETKVLTDEKLAEIEEREREREEERRKEKEEMEEMKQRELLREKRLQHLEKIYLDKKDVEDSD